MEVFLKVAAVAVACAVFGLVLRKNSPETALMLAVAVAVAALYMVFGALKGLVEFVKSAADAAQISPEALSVVFKAVGISIVSRLASDTCRDAGQSSAAAGVELAGAVAALTVALPLFGEVMRLIGSLA